MELRGRIRRERPRSLGNVAADGAPGGQGVIVAVLDTGVAYANRGPFRRSPDFSRYTFVKGYDFVANNPYPNDRNGHGTFVAGDDRRGHQQPLRPHRPGLRRAASCPCACSTARAKATRRRSPKASCSPSTTTPRSSTSASSSRRGVTAADIPELIEALDYAHRHDVLVVAAAGNEGHAAIAYPARAPDVVVGRRHHRTRLPRRLLQRRPRPDARRPRRRRRRGPARRPQLPSPKSPPGATSTR